MAHHVQIAVVVVHPEDQRADRALLLPKRKATTTASAVRTRLILTIPVRSPGSQGASARLAITPSPVPWSHWVAS